MIFNNLAKRSQYLRQAITSEVSGNRISSSTREDRIGNHCSKNIGLQCVEGSTKQKIERRWSISKLYLFFGAATIILSPLESGAFPTLSKNAIEGATTILTSRSDIDIGPYGTPIGSLPYFSSASASRLLVNPPSPIVNSRFNREAIKQLRKLQVLQDTRLSQCYEAQLDWEQCFYYGSNTIVNKDGTVSSAAAPLTLPDFGLYDETIQKIPFTSSTTTTNREGKPFRTKASVPTW